MRIWSCIRWNWNKVQWKLYHQTWFYWFPIVIGRVWSTTRSVFASLCVQPFISRTTRRKRSSEIIRVRDVIPLKSCYQSTFCSFRRICRVASKMDLRSAEARFYAKHNASWKNKTNIEPYSIVTPLVILDNWSLPCWYMHERQKP